jgi:replicative DNA helicase
MSEETATQLPAVDIAPPKPAEPIKRNLTGASFLANLIRTQHAAIKRQLDEAGTELVTAMTELQDTANEATNQVKAVKAETADLKAALGLNSNNEPV